jgi:hypothetical protein
MFSIQDKSVFVLFFVLCTIKYWVRKCTIFGHIVLYEMQNKGQIISIQLHAKKRNKQGNRRR